MGVWWTRTRLAISELANGFISRRRPPGSGAFWYLTGLLALLVTMLLIVVSGDRGVRNEITGTILGRIEGVGVPLILHVNLARGTAGADTTVAEAFLNAANARAPERTPLDLELVRTVEGGAASDVFGLVDQGIWSAESGEAMSGWAVDMAGPFWRTDPEPASDLACPDGSPKPFPNQLILDRGMFDRNFDLDLYARVLAEELAPEHHHTIPASLDDMTVLWLRIRIAENRQWVPFRTQWRTSISAHRPLAFLMPLRTHLLYRTTSVRPNLRYVGASEGCDGFWWARGVRAIPFEDGDLNSMRAALESVAACREAEVREDPLGLILALETAGPAARGWGCFAALDDLAENELQWVGTPGDAVGWLGDMRVAVPCQTVPADMALRHGNDHCTDPATAHDPAALSHDRGFRLALLYADPEQWDLTDLQQFIQSYTAEGGLCMSGTETNCPVFDLSPTYISALARFQYLLAVFEDLGLPVTIIGGVFVLSIALFSFGTVYSHRRRSFALMLVDGSGVGVIYAIVAVQTFCCAVFGSAIGIGLAEVAKRWVNATFRDSEAMALARSQLGVVDAVLLPPIWEHTLLIIPGVVAAAILVALASVFLLVLRPHRRTQPADLL